MRGRREIKQRKPRRPDWRQKPAKTRLPKMSLKEYDYHLHLIADRMEKTGSIAGLPQHLEVDYDFEPTLLGDKVLVIHEITDKSIILHWNRMDCDEYGHTDCLIHADGRVICEKCQRGIVDRVNGVFRYATQPINTNAYYPTLPYKSL